MNKQLPELLAPAGTPDAAWAALAYGADAVYAGLPRFSARAEAENFTPEALNELIGYAHHLNRRVYITFNTLVQQDELDDALETLALLRDLNANGVIVQDMGIVRLVQKNLPQLRLHASTQLAVHNLEGARQLAALGFKRVVLARELGLKDIAQITRDCGIETETFIHGALCYSYSGLCLFSSHLLGRSGNRGRCAYCCRQPFTDADGTENLPFSMKDFTAADHLSELISAGVASFKIEGRMKSPAYVAAVTDFYRRLADGKLGAEQQTQLLSDIQTIFGRPSTELYLTDPDTDPIEPVNAGHHGALIGTVREIRPGGWLVFRSNRSLQKHDGLKIETPGDTFAYGFAANDLRLASDPENKRHFELPADADIAVKLPSDAPRIEKGMSIYCSISQEIRQRYRFTAPRPGTYRQHRPVNIHINHTSEGVIFRASADGVESELVLPGPFEPARQPEKAADVIQQSFEKLGETDWTLNNLTLEGPSLFLPVSQINDARRRLIENFSKDWKLSRRNFQTLETFSVAPASPEIFWSVKTKSFQPLETFDALDEIVLEIDPTHPEEIEKALAAVPDKLRLALPVIIRQQDVEAYRKLIDRFSNVWKWEAANIGGLNLLRDVGRASLSAVALAKAEPGEMDITADWSLYTLNTQAALQWQELFVGQTLLSAHSRRQECLRHGGISRFVLSPEDDAGNLFELIAQLGDAAIIPVYQHTPLMISAARPAAVGELTDRSRQRFHIEQTGREFVLTADKPFSIVDRIDELKTRGARRFRIDLLYENGALDEIISRILAGQPVPGIPGNYDRELF